MAYAAVLLGVVSLIAICYFVMLSLGVIFNKTQCKCRISMRLFIMCRNKPLHKKYIIFVFKGSYAIFSYNLLEKATGSLTPVNTASILK